MLTTQLTADHEVDSQSLLTNLSGQHQQTRLYLKCFAKSFKRLCCILWLPEASQTNANNRVKVTILNPEVNILNANPTKWSNALRQKNCKLPTNCFSVFDHFVGLVLKVLIACNSFQNFSYQSQCTVLLQSYCTVLIKQSVVFPSWDIWVQVIKNGPSKICGRQFLKNLK